MPHDRLTEDTTECGLHSFERNHFFHGKLLTARDMQAEQHYHRNRLRTLAQQVLGSGIVCGLGTTVGLDDGALVVEIDRGLAIDDCGHPTVIETDATRELDPTDVPDPVSLYLDYRDARHETVPVPGTDGACEDECTYNRVVEGFELATEPDPPAERTTVEHVEFPDRADYATEGDGRDPTAIEVGDDALRSIAASFAEADDGSLRPCETGPEAGNGDENGDDPDAHRVFLGRFGTGDDGTWGRITDGVESRAHVHTNDMLYAAISRHAARFDDPHDVTAAQTGAIASVDGVSNPGGDVDLVEDEEGTVTITPDDAGNRIELEVGSAVTDRLDRLERDVRRLAGRVFGMERQLLRSTLQHKRAAFSLLSERFGIPEADEVVSAAEQGLSDSVYEDPEEYYEFLEEENDDGSTLVDLEGDVGDALRGVDGVSEAGLRQYLRAVGRLSTLVGQQSADQLDLESHEYFQRVARAQGLVAETAEWIAGGGGAPEPAEDPTLVGAPYTGAPGDGVDVDVDTGEADAIALDVAAVETDFGVEARFEPDGVESLSIELDTGDLAEADDRLSTSAGVSLSVDPRNPVGGVLPAGTYDVTLYVGENGSTRQVDASTVTLAEPTESVEPPSFQNTPYSVEAGSVATIDIDAGTVDSFEVEVTQSGGAYGSVVTVTPGSDATVPLAFDTSVAGTGSDPFSTTADATLDATPDDVDGAIAPDSYDVRLTVSDASQPVLQLATLAVEEPSDGEPSEFADGAAASLTAKEEAFTSLADEFGLSPAEEVATEAETAQAEGVHESGEAYADFVESVLAAEGDVLADLVEGAAATGATLGAYGYALQLLRTAVEDGADPSRLVQAQQQVTGAAERLETNEEGELSPALDPRDLTVREIDGQLEEVTSLGEAATVLAIEMATQERTTAIDAIVQRIRQLERQ